MAQIGFGTYRVTDLDPEHVEALRVAFDTGITLVDTSTNYMAGGAERAIAKAMFDLPDDKKDAIKIVSKFGYIQNTLIEYVKKKEFKEVVEFAEHIHHCIHPDFMRDQLFDTLQRLDTKKIECYLLHNPEYYLLDALNKGIKRSSALDEMYRRLYEVFIALEEEVQKGTMESYGISSNSFSLSPSNLEFLPYEDLLSIASKAAQKVGNSKHNFTTIQLPINVLELEGLKCAQWAHENKIRVMANRALNAMQDKLMFRLAEYSQGNEYYNYLNELLEITDNETLKSIHNLLNQLDEVKHKFGFIDEYEAFFHKNILPHIRSVIEKLENEEQLALSQLLELFFKEYKKMVMHETGINTRTSLKNIFAHGDKTMQRTALEFVSNEKTVDVLLVGMRKVSYVNEINSIFS